MSALQRVTLSLVFYTVTRERTFCRTDDERNGKEKGRERERV